MAVKGIRIKLNQKGIIAMLSSSEVSAELTRRGERMANAAGDGVEVTTTRNRDRAAVFVRTETFEAKRDEATNRTLTRAIDAGR